MSLGLETVSRKRGRPKDSPEVKAAKLKAKSKTTKGNGKSPAPDTGDEQEPITNFQKPGGTLSGSNDSESLVDPSLFAEMDTERIPQLEKVGRQWIVQDDKATKEDVKAKELAEQCVLIMHDHGIRKYDYKGLHLRIDSGKPKLKGELE